MEMSRQRLRPSLGETHSKICPRCDGVGNIRGTRSLALSILRLVEDEAQKERSAEIRAICPVSVATYLLNEKRKTISSIEARNSTRVVIVPSAELMTPHFEVQRLRDDDEGTLETSYKIVAHTDEAKADEEDFKAKPINAPKPIVQPSSPSQPAPEPVKKPGLLARLIGSISSIFGSGKTEESKGKREHKRDARRSTSGRNSRRDGRSNRRDKDRKEDRELVDNLEPRPVIDTKPAREQDKREGGRDNEKRESFSRDNNEQRRPRNNRDQSRDQQREQQPREAQAGDDEPRQPRNRNQRNERDTSRRPIVKEEPAVIAEAAISNEAPITQEDGDDQRPSKRPAGRRTRSQQRRRTRHDAEVVEGENTFFNTEGSETIAPAASDEPKVLSESAQLAQQISAAIAEHAQQTHALKSEQSESTDETLPTVDTTSLPSSYDTIDTPSNSIESPIEITQLAANGEADATQDTIPVAAAPAPMVVAETNTKELAPAVAMDVEIESLERQTTTEVNLAPPARASNDPRKAPKPVSQVSIITETIESQASRALDTSLPPSVDHNPRPLTRPSNDPRLNKRSTNE